MLIEFFYLCRKILHHLLKSSVQYLLLPPYVLSQLDQMINSLPLDSVGMPILRLPLPVHLNLRS